MSKIVVLFNLKDGVDITDYENWAKTTDLPTVNGLASVGSFEVLKSASLLGSEESPPYQYVEIIDVLDMEKFGSEVSTETMQKVAGEFQALADNPTFILTETL